MSEETNNVVVEETAATETAPVEPKAKTKFGKKLDGFFGVTKAGSTIRTELIAGLVTFLAMAYILVVNPNAITLFGLNNVPTAQLFISTALGAIVGSCLWHSLQKCLWRKLPVWDLTIPSADCLQADLPDLR